VATPSAMHLSTKFQIKYLSLSLSGGDKIRRIEIYSTTCYQIDEILKNDEYENACEHPTLSSLTSFDQSHKRFSW